MLKNAAYLIGQAEKVSCGQAHFRIIQVNI